MDETIEKAIKGIECCSKSKKEEDCISLACPYYAEKKCVENNAKDIIHIIRKLQTENDDLFYKLTGVMWFVDKWLEGKELKQDEVNRASLMREKTLEITEKQEEEIKKLKKIIENSYGDKQNGI